MRRTVTALALLGLALCLPGAAAQSAPAKPQELWVARSGSDLARCTHRAPCASFDRAYALARPGAVVRVAGGAYGPQTIQARPGRRAPRVVFRPAPKAKVTVAALTVHGSQVELRSMTVKDIEVPRDAHHVVFRGIRNHGIWMQGPSDVAFVGGEISCGVCSYHSHLDDGGPPDYRPPRRILFDGVYFHDWHAAEPGQHTECLQILAGDGITIRNSVFKNCATANDGRGATGDLHVSWLGNGPKTRNVLIENNFFFRSGNMYAIQANDYAGLELRYNSIVGPIILFGGYGDGTPVELVGNVMEFSDCRSQGSGPGPAAPLRFAHNILAGGVCDATDVNAPSGFVDPGSNLHLRPGAAAVDRGDPRSYPRRDIDGQRRPIGGRPDAGADEAR